MLEIKNLKKAAQRIKKAIKNNENIVLFSDADLDGTASLLIFEETIKSLGGLVRSCYFSNREKQGYGLSVPALNDFQKFAPGLLILSDTGIASFQEIKEAKKMGFAVIVVDHHEILDKLPEADIIIDPKQKSDDYPFKHLAACGLCFKLADILLPDSAGHTATALKQSFLELAALGTLADMMPQTDDNQILIEKGVSSLVQSLRPGIKVLADIFDAPLLSSKEFASKIISVIQLTDFCGNAPESYILLSSKDEKEARQLAEILVEKSVNRHQLARALVDEIREKLIDSSPIVFDGSSTIPHLLTGSISSKLCNKLEKATFIYSTKEKISRGSVRTPKGINGVEALNQCRALLEVYGGHAQACGFTVKNENIDKLRQCLIQHFQK